MNCICGKVLSNSEAPNDIELRGYTNKEWNSILANEIIESWNFPLPFLDIWKCPVCERLYVFDGEDKPHGVAKIYSLEKQETFFQYQ